LRTRIIVANLILCIVGVVMLMGVSEAQFQGLPPYTHLTYTSVWRATNDTPPLSLTVRKGDHIVIDLTCLPHAEFGICGGRPEYINADGVSWTPFHVSYHVDGEHAESTVEGFGMLAPYDGVMTIYFPVVGHWTAEYTYLLQVLSRY
jgi:hypothetical protein